MLLEKTKIPGAWIIRSKAFEDERGIFARLFCSHELRDVIGSRNIVQINQSITRSIGAVRGLHYQRPPHAEIKIVRCLRGRVFDVAVDLRADSPTFREWTAVELHDGDQTAFLIPEGCAHGFQVLERDSELLYLHTTAYAPEAEAAVRFDDPAIGIKWPMAAGDLSPRDQSHPYLLNTFEGIRL